MNIVMQGVPLVSLTVQRRKPKQTNPTNKEINSGNIKGTRMKSCENAWLVKGVCLLEGKRKEHLAITIKKAMEYICINKPSSKSRTVVCFAAKQISWHCCNLAEILSKWKPTIKSLSTYLNVLRVLWAYRVRKLINVLTFICSLRGFQVS